MSGDIAGTMLRAGDVVRYRSDRDVNGDRDAYWCLEGTAVVREDGAVFDTFWGSGAEKHRLSATEVGRAEIVFNLAEYDELDRWRPDRQKWSTYAKDDRARITSQHCLQERLFIRKGAAPDRSVMIAAAREKVAEADREVSAARRDLVLAQEDLGALLAAPDNCTCRPSWCTKDECPACTGMDWRGCKALPARLGGAS